MSAISVQRVSKLWGTTKAVDGVSFEVPAGKLVVLLGPSGCGKSTTLRLIAGLEPVSAGRIRIGGEDVTELPPSRRTIAMVFQSYALFPHLSVAELLGLTALLDRKPSQLSGGQQQRVALGRAIIAEKPVCLMDEPLSNLDAQLRAEMRREIRALQQTLGITMVYVTHDQTEAMTMADQVILLRAGRVEQDATPAALYARPATVFAARFIGTPPMNVIRDARDERRLLGVRPEDVRFSDADGLAARVVTVEYLGADSIVTCAVGAETLAVRAPGRVELAAGATVHLAWNPDAVHLFEATSGRRIDERQPALTNV